MHKFRVHVETDEDGSSWWCEDGIGFVAVASTLPGLKSLIEEWVKDEGLGEFDWMGGRWVADEAVVDVDGATPAEVGVVAGGGELVESGDRCN